MPNTTLTASGYGTRRFEAIMLAHGMRIDTSEDEARNHRTLYTMRQVADTVDLVLVLNSYEERVSAVKWLENYIAKVDAGDLGPLRVLVPAVNFDRTMILSRGLVHGDETGQILYPLRLELVGARNPLDPTKSSQVSRYEEARNDRANSRRFHPVGLQLPGESLYTNPLATPTGVWDRIDQIMDGGPGPSRPELLQDRLDLTINQGR